MSQVNVRLAQGFFDPLSLLTFKILPASAHLDRPDVPGFAEHPIGSGPFQLADDKRQPRDRQAQEVVFVANPNYRRTSKEGMPQIQEIHFVQSEDPVVDFKKDQLHLLLDVPTPSIKALEEKLGGRVQVQTLRNRRIYFLAVNHQNFQAKMLRSPELRKALAYSINRTQILDDIFRGDLKNSPHPPHRPLNGPYPPDSWACKPNLPPDLFKPLNVTDLKTKFSGVKLTLKYPAGDKLVEAACERIQEQVKEAIGVTIGVEPRSPEQLHDEVEVKHDYELAYYWYDYPSDAYWLWPLFNPDPNALGRGGRNYLGYDDSYDDFGRLVSCFQKAMSSRDPERIKVNTHLIHEHLLDTMPFIPLWQLDTHIAIHQDLKPVYLDPLLVFTHVEKWKLEKSK
jgi:ABC-type transport system substrate-binding protein